MLQLLRPILMLISRLFPFPLSCTSVLDKGRGPGYGSLLERAILTDAPFGPGRI
jgi:hypothetical protein